MNLRLLCFLACCLLGLGLAGRARAQAPTQIRGRVIDAVTNEPLVLVSVFVNNTTFGAVTDEKGTFTIRLKPGKYELIISYTGYEPIIFPVDLTQPVPPFLFKLSPRSYALGEVGITAKRDDSWHRNLQTFKEEFIGKSLVARQCKLQNPEALILAFDPKTFILTVKAKEPLIIENPALGYRIKYLLVEFEYDGKQQTVRYVGYPNFEALSGNSRQLKKWKKQRLLAYRGSAMHFIRALHQQELEKEGFRLRRLYRLPNPERPSEARIAAARAIMRQRRLAEIGSPGVLQPDSITDILSKANKPKFIDQLDTRPVPYGEYLQQQDSRVVLGFKDYFHVVYTREKEEFNYSRLRGIHNPGQTGYQTSVISLPQGPVTLEAMGFVPDPLGLLYEGYWSWEKVGDLLPLDYQPPTR